MSIQTNHLYGLKGAALKRKLARKEPILVVGLWLPYQLTAEMISRYPIDVLMLDMEHGPWDTKSVTELLIATAASDAAIVVRPGDRNAAEIRLLLDLGADGLMAAHCDSLAATKEVISATRYPPLGERGIGPTRTGAYLSDMPGYLRQANESIVLLLQVESQVSEEELTEMLSLPGVDGLLLGPADLAASMGYVTEWDRPEVIQVMSRTVDVARRMGIPFGVPGVVRPEWEDQLLHLSIADITALRDGLERGISDWQERNAKRR